MRIYRTMIQDYSYENGPTLYSRIRVAVLSTTVIVIRVLVVVDPITLLETMPPSKTPQGISTSRPQRHGTQRISQPSCADVYYYLHAEYSTHSTFDAVLIRSYANAHAGKLYVGCTLWM